MDNMTGKGPNGSTSGAPPHPLNYVPQPNQRGGHNVRLESIDHTQHQLQANLPRAGGGEALMNKLPSPMGGGKRNKQLDPIAR